MAGRIGEAAVGETDSRRLTMRTLATLPSAFVRVCVIPSRSAAVSGAWPWMICAPRMSSTIPATSLPIASASLRLSARVSATATSAVSLRPSSVSDEMLRVTESIF
jgi:hypothetical protein